MERTNYEAAMAAIIPARTDTYSPIPHADFLDLINQRIAETRRLTVTGQRLYVKSGGNKLVGFTSVRYSNVGSDPEFGLEMMLGYKNSYDKSMAAALAAGVQVMICENGLIAGDLLEFKRKHTGNVRNELSVKIDEAIIKMEEGFTNLVVEVDIMKDYDLTPRQKAEILGIMYFEEEIVTPTQLSIVKKELRESEHFRGNTLWDLYNNVTESLKTSYPVNHIADHIKLHSFMRDVAGIAPEEIRDSAEAPQDESAE